MNKEKIYFPNLNGLRFIAALLVIIPHIEEFKSIYKIDNYLGVVKTQVGHLSVVLFFVLSGFLITYLLLIEEKITDNINIKNFYIRRILKIWPLYFLIIILALFILPNFSFFIVPGFSKDIIWDNLTLKTILYFTFFSNLAGSFGIVPCGTHTWSIGSEEQFYLVWPVIMKAIKNNRILLMISVIIFYNIIKEIVNSHYLDLMPNKGMLVNFWRLFSIDCMATGGLFAVLSFYDNKILIIIQNRMFFYITIIVTLFLLTINFSPFYRDEFYAILFGIIILNFAKTKNIYLSLENKMFNFLGKISYGLYMYHPIAIVITLKIGLYTNILTNYFFYPFTIMLTIAIAYISYISFEMKFLSLKSKFSTVISGDNTKSNDILLIDNKST